MIKRYKQVKWIETQKWYKKVAVIRKGIKYGVVRYID